MLIYVYLLCYDLVWCNNCDDLGEMHVSSLKFLKFYFDFPSLFSCQSNSIPTCGTEWVATCQTKCHVTKVMLTREMVMLVLALWSFYLAWDPTGVLRIFLSKLPIPKTKKHLKIKYHSNCTKNRGKISNKITSLAMSLWALPKISLKLEFSNNSFCDPSMYFFFKYIKATLAYFIWVSSYLSLIHRHSDILYVRFQISCNEQKIGCSMIREFYVRSLTILDFRSDFSGLFIVLKRSSYHECHVSHCKLMRYCSGFRVRREGTNQI